MALNLTPGCHFTKVLGAPFSVKVHNLGANLSPKSFSENATQLYHYDYHINGQVLQK